MGDDFFVAAVAFGTGALLPGALPCVLPASRGVGSSPGGASLGLVSKSPYNMSCIILKILGTDINVSKDRQLIWSNPAEQCHSHLQCQSRSNAMGSPKVNQCFAG
jgi:hypothetical protein